MKIRLTTKLLSIILAIFTASFAAELKAQVATPTPQPTIVVPKEWNPKTQPKAVESFENIEISPGVTITRGYRTHEIESISGNISIDGANTSEEAVFTYLKHIHDILGLTDDLSDLQLVKKSKNKTQDVFLFRQLFKGVRVNGAILSVNVKPINTIQEITPAIESIPETLDVTKTISNEEAIAIAKQGLSDGLHTANTWLTQACNFDDTTEVDYAISHEVSGLTVVWIVSLNSPNCGGLWDVYINNGTKQVIRARGDIKI